MNAFPETMKISPTLAAQLERVEIGRHDVRQRAEGALAGRATAERVKAAIEAIRREATAP